MQYHEVNINQYCKVRLTDLGRKIHKEHDDKCLSEVRSKGYLPDYEPPKEDSEGYVKFHLWELMQVFGPEMRMGCENCFDLQIKVAKEL